MLWGRLLALALVTTNASAWLELSRNQRAATARLTLESSAAILVLRAARLAICALTASAGLFR
jgi:hypothetical protein